MPAVDHGSAIEPTKALHILSSDSEWVSGGYGWPVCVFRIDFDRFILRSWCTKL